MRPKYAACIMFRWFTTLQWRMTDTRSHRFRPTCRCHADIMAGSAYNKHYLWSTDALFWYGSGHDLRLRLGQCEVVNAKKNNNGGAFAVNWKQGSLHGHVTGDRTGSDQNKSTQREPWAPAAFFPGVGKLGVWRRKSPSGGPWMEPRWGLRAKPLDADDRLWK